MAARPTAASSAQTLLYLGRPEEALRIADELEPLARKIGDIFTVARCLSTRAWTEFGKAPDLAKVETGLGQMANRPTEHSGFWEAVFRAQLSVLDFFRGDWAGALLLAQASCRFEAGSAVEGIGVGTLFRQMAYAGDRDGALAILDERRALMPRSGQHNAGGSWWMLALVLEGFAMLNERSRAAELYPLARELISTGAVSLWPIFRFTHTIAGIALLPGFRGCGAASGINYFARDQPLNFRFAAAELRKISTLCCPVTGADRRFRRESARDR